MRIRTTAANRRGGRELLVHRPNQHAATEILAKPGASEQDQPGYDQLRQEENETLDDLGGEIGAEDVHPEQHTAQQDAPIDRLSHQTSGAKAARRVHQEGNAALAKELVDGQAFEDPVDEPARQQRSQIRSQDQR